MLINYLLHKPTAPYTYVNSLLHKPKEPYTYVNSLLHTPKKYNINSALIQVDGNKIKHVNWSYHIYNIALYCGKIHIVQT